MWSHSDVDSVVGVDDAQARGSVGDHCRADEARCSELGDVEDVPQAAYGAAAFRVNERPTGLSERNGVVMIPAREYGFLAGDSELGPAVHAVERRRGWLRCCHDVGVEVRVRACCSRLAPS